MFLKKPGEGEGIVGGIFSLQDNIEIAEHLTCPLVVIEHAYNDIIVKS